MVAWPAALPQSAFVQASEIRQDATIRSNMDSGAPKLRKRFTAAIRELSIRMILNGTEKAAFDTFYITTISEGALAFDMKDPVDDNTISVRFKQPPLWALISASGTVAQRLWESTLQLEVLP